MEQQFVMSLNQWVNAHSAAAIATALMAQWGIAVPIVALAALWFWPGTDRQSRREAVMAGGISIVLAFLLSYMLEHSLARPRPFVALPIHALLPHSNSSSFPSDHTLLGAAVVAPLLWRFPKLGILPMLWVLLVGFARVAAGLHYPSDILGSMLLAALPAAIGLFTYPVLYRLPLVRTLVRSGA